jgi:hypothetical protein
MVWLEFARLPAGSSLPLAQKPLAPRVVGVALDHRAGLVGEDRDRAEAVLVEVAHRGSGVVAQHVQPYHGAAHPRDRNLL